MLDKIKSLIRIKSIQQRRSSRSRPAANPDHRLRRPTRSFPEFFEHVKRLGFIPRTVIDVGVATGTPSLYEAFPDAYLVLVDPVEEFVPDMQKILVARSGEYHCCALSAATGQSTILKTKKLRGSTLMHRHQGESDRLQPVTVETLDRMLLERTMGDPYLLKIDCQGGDLDVVKGGVGTLQHCEIVILEVSLFKFWGDHHPELLDILNFMSEHGFAVYDLLDGLYRPYDNALGQIDIAFVKKNGRFRTRHFWVRR